MTSDRQATQRSDTDPSHTPPETCTWYSALCAGTDRYARTRNGKQVKIARRPPRPSSRGTRVYEIFARTVDAYSDRLRFAPRKHTFSMRGWAIFRMYDMSITQKVLIIVRAYRSLYGNLIDWNK